MAWLHDRDAAECVQRAWDDNAANVSNYGITRWLSPRISDGTVAACRPVSLRPRASPASRTEIRQYTLLEAALSGLRLDTDALRTGSSGSEPSTMAASLSTNCEKPGPQKPASPTRIAGCHSLFAKTPPAIELLTRCAQSLAIGIANLQTLMMRDNFIIYENCPSRASCQRKKRVVSSRTRTNTKSHGV